MRLKLGRSQKKSSLLKIRKMTCRGSLSGCRNDLKVLRMTVGEWGRRWRLCRTSYWLKIKNWSSCPVNSEKRWVMAIGVIEVCRLVSRQASTRELEMTWRRLSCSSWGSHRKWWSRPPRWSVRTADKSALPHTSTNICCRNILKQSTSQMWFLSQLTLGNSIASRTCFSHPLLKSVWANL